ncbi:FecR family protein [Synechococcus elongatus]|uniref:FecR family protein n=1 Tax=Synechococcus elongatus PCC 11801 TaxID=2219813 RepID=A0AAQ3MBB1_SYNEL|nr:FecR family protein [Synechococcus elongatus]
MWRAIAVASVVLTACTPTQQLQAEIQEVATSPVFASQPNQAEQPASEGTVVIQGGQIRTESPGKAQIQLSDGLQFRLGGNALLKIEPELQLDRGQIIAWLGPGQQRDRPLQIRTPTATAAIRGTTVFIEQTATQTLILSWEGLVEVQLPSGASTQLTSGQVLRQNSVSRRVCCSTALPHRWKPCLKFVANCWGRPSPWRSLVGWVGRCRWRWVGRSPSRGYCSRRWQSVH